MSPSPGMQLKAPPDEVALLEFRSICLSISCIHSCLSILASHFIRSCNAQVISYRGPGGAHMSRRIRVAPPPPISLEAQLAQYDTLVATRVMLLQNTCIPANGLSLQTASDSRAYNYVGCAGDCKEICKASTVPAFIDNSFCTSTNENQESSRLDWGPGL